MAEPEPPKKQDGSPPEKPQAASQADEATIIGSPVPRPRPAAAPTARRTGAVPLPTPAPVIAANLPAELLSLVEPTLTTQDLTRDKLLQGAPLAQIGAKRAPMVGGIPLLVKMGQGGLGAVYYGIHPGNKAGVAVKVVPVASAPAEAIQRFYNEVRVAAKIKSGHLVPIKDLGEEKGLYYVITGFIPGTASKSYLNQLKEGGATGLPEAEALDAVIGAVKGLAEAHKSGMIHGDFRPENILIPKDRESGNLLFERALLADLGLPRVEELGGVLSGSNAALGTPGYMAPEAAADAASARKHSDVFSVGATLYHLLAGDPPFPMENPMVTIMHTINTPHQPMIKRRKEISPATSELLDRCLAKKPSERYVDASTLLEALTVCRVALTEPKVTQRSAIKRITMMLEKQSEVGQKVLGTDSSTPSSLQFVETLAAEARKKTAGPGAMPKKDDAAAAPQKGATAPVPPPPPAPPPPPSPPQPQRAAPQAEEVTMFVPAPKAPGQSSGLVKVAVGVIIAALAIVALVAVLVASRSGPSPEVVESHQMFLKDARRFALESPDEAKALLEQARKLKIRDSQWREREEAVETFIQACQLYNKGAEAATVERMLKDVEKVYPGDEMVGKVKDRLRRRRGGD